MIKITKKDGTQLKPGALTFKMLTKMMYEDVEPDYSLLLKFAEGEMRDTIAAVGTLDPLAAALIEIRPEIVRVFTLFYQLGVLAEHAVQKNHIEIEEVAEVEAAEEVHDITTSEESTD